MSIYVQNYNETHSNPLLYMIIARSAGQSVGVHQHRQITSCPYRTETTINKQCSIIKVNKNF